jgi:hypothetical protein
MLSCEHVVPKFLLPGFFGSLNIRGSQFDPGCLFKAFPFPHDYNLQTGSCLSASITSCLLHGSVNFFCTK